MKVRRVTLAIFFDVREEIEIRIAAFEVYMTTVDADTTFPSRYIELIEHLKNEKNDSVRSFTCTYLMALQESEDPTIRTQ